MPDNKATLSESYSFLFSLSFIRKTICSLRFLHFLIMVFSGAGLLVSLKITLSRNPKNTYFIFQSGVLVYGPSCLLILLFRVYINKISIPAKTKTFGNILKFVFFAALDTLDDLFQVFGANATSLALQSLLPQIVIPISMIFSILICKAIYKKLHYIAAGIILIGETVAIIPFLNIDQQGTKNSAYGPILLLLSSIPASTSAIYKQLYLQDRQVSDLWYMNTYVTFFQILWGFIISPLNTLEIFTENPVEFQELPSQFLNGFLFTFSSFYTAFPWFLFISFVIIFNYEVLVALKHSSASFMYIVACTQLPLTNMVSSSELIMGDAAAGFSIYSILALLLVLIGLILFAIEVERTDRENKKEQLDIQNDDNNSLELGTAENRLLKSSDSLDDDDNNNAAYFGRYYAVPSTISSKLIPNNRNFIEPKILRRRDNSGMRANYLGSLGFNISPRLKAKKPVLPLITNLNENFLSSDNNNMYAPLPDN